MRPLEKEIRLFLQKYLKKEKHADLLRVIKASHRDYIDLLDALASGRLEEARRSRFLREAAERLLKVFRQSQPEAVFLRIAAMFLMEERNPRAFRSDTAFEYQLATATRRLTKMYDKMWWDSKRQTTANSQSRISRQTMNAMGSILRGYASVRVSWLLGVMKEREALEADTRTLLWERAHYISAQIKAERIKVQWYLSQARAAARKKLDAAS